MSGRFSMQGSQDTDPFTKGARGKGAGFSLKIERSKARLPPFFENVGIETPKVPGTRDQLDLNFSQKSR
ncbi:MAG: hypothetical protein H0A75_07835 [Candidatus Methanofishera endochildressiae]|uniref:Uncharacterized protein n=1 Tax=Candidatus Methanofishera endochildressiae TaxID=2738884 RepID=A0A7Z0SDB9_9GAMM|nr:hypothetical protein [Candidatus Methanofishera endochildressiae]